MGAIQREVYREYISLVTEAERIKKTILLPHALKIVGRLEKERPDDITFGDGFICFDGDYDCFYRLEGEKFELLFREDWGIAIVRIQKERRLRYARLAAKNIRQSKEAEEKRERAELARLLVKYPDAAAKTP